MRFAPTDVGFIGDPYGDYEELRRSAPVVYDEATDHWLISRYRDVDALLRDRRFGRTYLHMATHEEMSRPTPPEWHSPFWDLINAGILDMEPPDHTRVRKLVSKAFTPKFVEALRPRVQTIFDGLVDGLEHLALGLGGYAGPPQRDAPPPTEPLVRPHSECLTGDVFGSERCDCGPQLREAVARIEEAGGYLLYLRQEGRGIGLY